MEHGLFINGEWRHAANCARLETVDPATEEVFDEVACGGIVDIDLAVAAARTAYEAGWGKTPPCERAALLRAIAAGIRARVGDLARLEVRDNGKPLPEAEWDINDAADCFDFYADLAEDLGRDEPVALSDNRFVSRVRREPVGVAGLIIPWNYPLLMAAWKVAPALAAGCTAVLKPSELTPLTALELASIASEAGLPRGVLNVVNGHGVEAGARLAGHPDVDKTAFTGSVSSGCKVMKAAAADIKAVSLELGGKSPVVVFADADIDKAVEWIMFGIFWNQGEVCSATSRLIVEERISKRLLERLVEASRAITIGSGLEEGVKLGPLVSKGQYEKVLGFIEAGKRDGARLLTGGGRPARLQRGYFVEPTILADAGDHNPVWTDEVFGPVLAVRTFRTEEEALRLANDTKYGLGAAVISADPARCDRVAEELRAGIVWVNCSQPTFVQAPWGGMKKSGFGRELGRWGLENYLEVKQITTYRSAEPWGWYGKPAAS